ncbi:hypothetical protein ACJX0J_040561, partial [Zea mays]
MCSCSYVVLILIENSFFLSGVSLATSGVRAKDISSISQKICLNFGFKHVINGVNIRSALLTNICSLGFRIVFMVQHTIRRFFYFSHLYITKTLPISIFNALVNPKHLLFELGKITKTEASFAVQKRVMFS